MRRRGAAFNNAEKRAYQNDETENLHGWRPPSGAFAGIRNNLFRRNASPNNWIAVVPAAKINLSAENAMSYLKLCVLCELRVSFIPGAPLPSFIYLFANVHAHGFTPVARLSVTSLANARSVTAFHIFAFFVVKKFGRRKACRCDA